MEDTNKLIHELHADLSSFRLENQVAHTGIDVHLAKLNGTVAQNVLAIQRGETLYESNRANVQALLIADAVNKVTDQHAVGVAAAHTVDITDNRKKIASVVLQVGSGIALGGAVVAALMSLF